MIENLRKYTGLIIVLFVLVIVGFVLMDTNNMRASGGGVPVIKVDGKSYSDKEFRKLGPASFELTQGLADFRSGDFQKLFPFIIALSGDAQSEDQRLENFFVNRMILRSAKEEFGIYPSDAQINTFISTLRLFTGMDGEFSQEAYRNFIERGIGRLGLTENDIRELASDVIVFEQLTKILGSGLSENKNILSKISAFENQRIRLSLARIDRDPILKTIEPTEDEIKSHWETIQDAFKTEEKRQFTYFVAKAEIPAEPAAIEPLPEGATEEQKTEHAKKTTERDAAIADAKRLAQLAVSEKVDDFIYKLESQSNLSFEKLATDEKWELITSDLFAAKDAPEALKATLRASRTQGTAVDLLFEMKITSDPLSKISPAIAIGENDWIVAHLDNIEPSRTQTYEEARDEARARLIADKADTALKEAAEKATESIKTALAEGKSFAEACTAAGITTEVISIPDVTSNFQPSGRIVPANLFAAAQFTKPSELTEPVIESDRAFIIHVEARELVTNPEADAALQARFMSAAGGNGQAAFSAWLNNRFEAAKVERLNR